MSGAGVVRAAGVIVRRARRHPRLTFWSAVILAMAGISFIGPFFLQPPNVQHLLIPLRPPSGAHWLGTDEFGRDNLSRVVSAGRTSLGLGAAVTVASILFGSSIGMVAAFYARQAAFLMRITDAFQAFPAIVLAIALAVALVGKVPGVVGELVALAVVYTPLVARVVRSRVLVLANTGYVAAAKASGVRKSRILVTHITPNCVPVIIVQTTFVYATSILSDAALSFLGLGVAPPTPTWGNMIADARSTFATAPWPMIAPGLAIVISVASLSLVGDGVRILVDPRARAVQDMQQLKQRMRGGVVARERAQAKT